MFCVRYTFRYGTSKSVFGQHSTELQLTEVWYDARTTDLQPEILVAGNQRTSADTAAEAPTPYGLIWLDKYCIVRDVVTVICSLLQTKHLSTFVLYAVFYN